MKDWDKLRKASGNGGAELAMHTFIIVERNGATIVVEFEHMGGTLVRPLLHCQSSLSPLASWPCSLRRSLLLQKAFRLQHSSCCWPASSTPPFLMSSRFAPPFLSSSLYGAHLQLFMNVRISRRRHAPTVLSASSVGHSACTIAQLGKCCGREARCVVRSRFRKNKGRRLACCSSQAGSDQPTSSVLPPHSPAAKAKGLRISFCPRCGGATEEKIPVGEHEMRFVCTACGSVHYQNPKMVVGCLVVHEEQVLLCRRNNEPSYGLWTLPAGYMEIGESAAEGAARETWEEACADVQVLGLFAHLDIPFIGQSYIIFHARMKNPHFAPGAESLECALFKLEDIPFDKLAFSSIYVALKLYVEDIKAGQLRVHHGVIDKRQGAAPSDLKGFAVRDLLST